MNKRSLASLALFLCCGSVLAVIGYWMLFTTFMVYDDEGYVLISLRNYIVHGGLYDQVYSQYGPFFYHFYDALQRVLPLEYDNASGRWITLVNWLATAGASSLLAWRYTRSTIHALFALGMTFFFLWVMQREPMHPGSLLTALVALGTVSGFIAIEREHPVPFAIGGALFGVALLLTKINVGVFFITAIGSWMLVNTVRSPASRFSPAWLVALGCVLLPFSLMQSLWSAPWVRVFAMIAATSALSLALVLKQSRRPEHTPSTWGWLLGVGAALAFFIGLLTWLRGTSVMALIDGVILEPLKHPGVFPLLVVWNDASVPIAIGSFVLALWFHLGKKRPPAAFTVIAGLRFFILAGFLLSGHPSMGDFGLLYGMPLIWLLVTPLNNGEITNLNRARLWAGWVLVFQSLHAYPVAGSQINFGTCLFPATLTMGVYEALVYFKALLPSFARRLTITTGALLLIPLAWMTATVGKTSSINYHERQPLGLRGIERIRLSEGFTDTLRIITGNLQLHANTVFGFPGLYSMNLWAGKPTPTLANAPHWFTLLTPTQQEAIIDRLKADPDACIVVQRDVIDFLKTNGYRTGSLLTDYLGQEFSTVLKLDGYALCFHKQRSIQPINIVKITQIGSGPRLLLTGIVPAHAQQIARVELRNYEMAPLVIQTIEPGPTIKFTTTTISPGDPSFASIPSEGLVRFTAEFTGAFNSLNPHNAFVILKADDGHELSRMRFAH